MSEVMYLASFNGGERAFTYGGRRTMVERLEMPWELDLVWEETEGSD